MEHISDLASCFTAYGCSDVGEAILISLAVIPQVILAFGVVKSVFNLEEKYSVQNAALAQHMHPFTQPAPAG